MSSTTSMAMPPRALRRNRFLISACALIGAPIIGLSLGLSSLSSKPGPLLLSIDAMKVSSAGGLPQSPAPMIEAQAVAPAAAINEIAVETPAEAVAREESDSADQHQRFFNGRPVKPAKTITMVVTAYSPDARSCGNFADGITASGLSVWTNDMKLAAADTSRLPFGTMISVPGYDGGNVIPVLDRGGAIKGNRLDLLFPTHEQAIPWGRKTLEVTVWEYADGKPNDFVPRYK